MLSIFIYCVFLTLHILIFMYQRATLTIARLLQSNSVSEIQIILTPVWLGVCGWITAIGFYGSLIYIWFQYGILCAILGFIFSHFLSAAIPIPSSFIYELVIKHLRSEIMKNKNPETKKPYESLLLSVERIKATYKVS